MPHDPPDQNLLVKATLEAVLSQSSSRLNTVARLERVKAAALIECAEKGYANLTIAEVARRSKVSTATIYSDYRDRDALLVAAMEMLLGILAGDVIATPELDNPRDRVEALLLAHGAVYAEPFATWVFRLHVHLAWSGYPHLREIGLRVFNGIDAFWSGLLSTMVEQGHLIPLHLETVVPILLGPIERCTIIARLACGDQNDHPPSLAEAARFGADLLFDLWGSAAYRRTYSPASIARVGGAPLPPTVVDGPRVKAIEAAMAAACNTAPSILSRLEAAMAGTGERPSPEDRIERILLAAAAECQERGYNAASMTEVAARAGVSTATLYKRYTDKPDLFAGALAQEMRIRSDGLLRSAEATAAPDDLARTIAVAAGLASDPESAWIPNIVMASEISNSPQIVRIAREHRDLTEQYLGSRLQRLEAETRLRPGDQSLCINFLLGAAERTGALALILFGPSALDRAKIAQLACATSDVFRLWRSVA